MECPKCRQENSDEANFCTRCHATLCFKCPACGNGQRHGGRCEKCGVDFLKYAAMAVLAERTAADQKRSRVQHLSSLLRSILFAPITGGMSLVRYFLLSRDR